MYWATPLSKFKPLSSSALFRNPHALKDGRERLLDAGCCFGQDIRKLFVDGTPAANPYCLEIESKFVDLRYNLFRHREKLRSSFIISRILDDSEQSAPSNGQIDILAAIKSLHFWDWESQFTAACRLA
jgi:hypothetical protein